MQTNASFRKNDARRETFTALACSTELKKINTQTERVWRALENFSPRTLHQKSRFKKEPLKTVGYKVD